MAELLHFQSSFRYGFNYRNVLQEATVDLVNLTRSTHFHFPYWWRTLQIKRFILSWPLSGTKAGSGLLFPQFEFLLWHPLLLMWQPFLIREQRKEQRSWLGIYRHWWETRQSTMDLLFGWELKFYLRKWFFTWERNLQYCQYFYLLISISNVNFS